MPSRRRVAGGPGRDDRQQGTNELLQDLQAKISQLEEGNRTLARINESFSTQETRIQEANQVLRSENMYLNSTITALQKENQDLRRRVTNEKHHTETRDPNALTPSSINNRLSPLPSTTPSEGRREVKRSQSTETRASLGIPAASTASRNVPPITKTPQQPLRSTGLRAPARKEPSNYAESPPPNYNTEREERNSRDKDDAYERELQETIRDLRRSERLQVRPGGDDGRQETDQISGDEDEDMFVPDYSEHDDLYEPSDHDEDVVMADDEDRSRSLAPSPGASTSRQVPRPPRVQPSNKRKNASTDADDGEATTSKKPRYSKPRQTKDRFAVGRLASGPVGFKFVKMARTTQGVWDAWYHGTEDNPSIFSLEEEHGVGWRNHPGEMGYASDYVTKRRLIVQGITKWAKRHDMSNEDLMTILDGRARGRVVSDLLEVLRRPEETDPLQAIQPRVV